MSKLYLLLLINIFLYNNIYCNNELIISKFTDYMKDFKSDEDQLEVNVTVTVDESNYNYLIISADSNKKNDYNIIYYEVLDKNQNIKFKSSNKLSLNNLYIPRNFILNTNNFIIKFFCFNKCDFYISTDFVNDINFQDNFNNIYYSINNTEDYENKFYFRLVDSFINNNYGMFIWSEKNSTNIFKYNGNNNMIYSEFFKLKYKNLGDYKNTLERGLEVNLKLTSDFNDKLFFYIMSIDSKVDSLNPTYYEYITKEKCTNIFINFWDFKEYQVRILSEYDIVFKHNDQTKKMKTESIKGKQMYVFTQKDFTIN